MPVFNRRQHLLIKWGTVISTYKPVVAPTCDAQKKKSQLHKRVLSMVQYIKWDGIQLLEQVQNEMGQPINHKDGSGSDHTTFHGKDGNLFAITQCECGPGVIYL